MSLDPCPDFMEGVVGQALSIIHISQHFLPVLQGTHVVRSKVKIDEKFEMDVKADLNDFILH